MGPKKKKKGSKKKKEKKTGEEGEEEKKEEFGDQFIKLPKYGWMKLEVGSNLFASVKVRQFHNVSCHLVKIMRCTNPRV